MSRVHSPTFPSLRLCYNAFSNPSVALPTSQFILQPFRHFDYVTTHSPTLPSLYLRHNSFSNPSVASPKSQFILQPSFRFSYVTSSSLNSPGETPMVQCFLSPDLITRLEMFVQGTQTQVKDDTNLAWFYLSVSLLSSVTQWPCLLLQ